MDLDFILILELAGFDRTLKTRLVRHQDKRFDLAELRRNDQFELYQAYQSKPKFHGVQQIVSFYGLPGSRAAFYGVYAVLGHGPPRDLSSRDYSHYRDDKADILYDLRRHERFDFLRDRLIID